MTTLRDQLQATLGSSYFIDRELGGGGMARVFVARDEVLGRDVVVKVVAPEHAEGVSAERFAREVKLAARLQQANIVPVLAAGMSGGLPYYTMPFVRGESLRGRLADGAPLSISDSIGILRDVARALAFAHDEHVVHRDIKPENILLSGGAAVVTDFGIAKAIVDSRTHEGATATGLTQLGTSLGTPAYMAPEQALGDPNTDHRADIYAWGVVGWELLVGSHPFAEKTTAHAIVAAHIAEPPPSLAARRPDAPRSLAALIMRCLEKDPEQRPSSAAELLDVIDALHGQPEAPLPAAIAPRRQWYGRAMLAGGLLAALAAAAILALELRNGGGVVATKSLAVMPFTAVGADTSNTYLAEGIADEVTNTLAQVPGLRLAGRTSAARLAARNATPREVGATLQVANVLDGTVRREGGQIHVTVELANAADGMVIWQDSFDKPATDIFSVQGEIARAIAARLQVTLSGAGSGSLASSGTRDAAAYDLYLKGMYLYRRRGPAIEDAIAAFQQATERDSTFARAWAAFSNALTVSPSYLSVHPGDVLPRARAAAERAVSLNPALADGHLALGYVLAEQFDWAAADSELRRAVELDPNSAEARYRLAYSLFNQGRIIDAIPELRRGVANDPLYFMTSAYLGWAEVQNGQPAEGIADLRRSVALEPRSVSALSLMASSYDRLGERDSARSYAYRIVGVTSEPTRLGVAAFILARNGGRAAADTLLRRLEATPRTQWGHWTGLLHAYLGVGDTARAVEALEGAAAGDGDGLPNYMIRLKGSLASNPRVLTAIRRYNLDPSRFVSATEKRP